MKFKFKKGDLVYFHSDIPPEGDEATFFIVDGISEKWLVSKDGFTVLASVCKKASEGVREVILPIVKGRGR